MDARLAPLSPSQSTPLRRAMTAACALLCLAGALPAGARAQPVNAEAMAPDPFAPGWSGGLEGQLALSRGNVELLDVGGGGRVVFQTIHPQAGVASGGEDADASPPDPPPFVDQRVLLTGNARFAENDEGEFIDQGFVHLRWSWMWLNRLGSDVFAQYQFNRFQRLLSRGVAGAGPRVDIVHRRALWLYGGSAYMFEFERIDVEPGAPDDDETISHRWSNFVTVRLELLDAQLLAQNTLFVQPRFDDFGDFRVLDELSLKARLNALLSLGLSVSVLHDSRPPTGVDKTDLSLTNTLGVSF